MSKESYYIGVDVGTGSARASLIRADGHLAASSTKETKTFRDQNDHRIFEQSTNNIWDAISTCIKECLAQSKVPPASVHGIGFDATCSLAVSDMNMEPVTVTGDAKLGQHGDRNVILWADHRAEKEADLINSTGSIVLDYVGGTMSLEMEVPKVLWLKNHMKQDLFTRCQFFDLPDFLTYRATGDTTRSVCSVTCKCSFVPGKGWQAEFFNKIGLEAFPKNEYKQMGADKLDVLNAGSPVGKGLSKKSAEEFGLLEGTPVGSGLIDAYAGWMGTVGAKYKFDDKLVDKVPVIDEARHRIAAVAGTSTCHIVQSPNGVFVNGVWGPYKDPVMEGWWMNEGGQSSTGQLIDFMLTTHKAYPQVCEMAKEQGKNVHVLLAELLEQLRVERNASSAVELTKDIHFYPDLHGNRSPLADYEMRGSIVGLALDDSVHDLSRKYYLTMEAIALQTKHIIDEMNKKGHQITSIYMSGGQAKNIRMMQLFADTCNMDVVLPYDSGGAVVLGAAMLGRIADEMHKGKGHKNPEDHNALIWNIMTEMTPPGTLIKPSASEKDKKLLAAKYKIFREAIDIQRRWRKEMAEASK